MLSPPSELFPELADSQDATARKTGELSSDMAKAAQTGGPTDGQTGGQCGQQQVANAAGCMQQASGQLKKQHAGAATKEQEKAIQELAKALEEIQHKLAELGEEMRDEAVVQLQDIFGQMLVRQQAASASTTKLDQNVRQSGGTLRRSQRLALKELAQEERNLAEMAQGAYDMLVEDGASIVFPPVVEDLRHSLDEVGRLLDEQRMDDYTQTRQGEIESTLAELIDALQKTAAESDEAGGEAALQGRPRLVSSIAELKLLRTLQLRVNRRTKAFESARPLVLDGMKKSEIADIAELQKEISQMVEQLLERIE
jgi:hypothetical protein